MKKVMQKIIKDFSFYMLVLFFALFVFSLGLYGVKNTSKIIQSFGVGFGSFLAGLAGLTAFLDWFNKKNKAEKYIKELKNNYPRSLLKNSIKIVQKTDTDMIYLLDERNGLFKKRWFQDRQARKDLGFTWSDTSESMTEEALKKYTEEDPIVSKENFIG